LPELPERIVVRAAYLLRQRFRYAYPGPIRNLRHRLLITPPAAYGDQVLVSDKLTVAPDVSVRWREDAFGNAMASIVAPRIDDAIALDYEAVVERSAGPSPTIPARWFRDVRYRHPSRLTEPDDALRRAAARLARDGGDAYTLASRINAYVYDHMRYVPDATNVTTTAAEAYTLGIGVCQDYAHVMIALCRTCGVPARYVSGHLLGEGGTHAWVEVIADPQGERTAAVWGFDPTHRRETTLSYLFVAAGRDFADVTPTSGRFVAPYVGEFTTSRSVAVVRTEFAA
jgi:transglutaminase-like putative cysteine protease